MPDERAPWEQASAGVHYDASAADLAELRELILGAERRRLEELERRLDAAGLTREELAELLPEAIALRAGRDRQLARALAPTVESAIGESVRRNPRPIATAIFPVLGPAIRKAIAEALAGLVSSINRALEHSLSPRGLRWRLEAWRTGVPYAQIVLRHALVYRVEQVFLIHADTGLLLAHAVAPELAASDADLISGMLTAIRDFVADSFSREREAGGLRRFSVGELTVMVEQGPQALIAAVVRGEAPDTLLPAAPGHAGDDPSPVRGRARRLRRRHGARSPRPGRCWRSASRRWSRPTGRGRGAGAWCGFPGRLPRSSWRSCSAGSRCGRGCAGTGRWRGSGRSPASC